VQNRHGEGMVSVSVSVGASVLFFCRIQTNIGSNPQQCTKIGRRQKEVSTKNGRIARLVF